MQRHLEIEGVSSNDALLRALQHVPQFNLGPHQVRYSDWKVTISDRVSLGINGTARNGTWFQAIRYRYLDGQWVKASRITKGNKIISESIDDKFPRTASGETEWDSK